MCIVDAREGDLSNSVKNGILYLEDPLDQTWTPHFFVLTSNKLYYSEETSHEEEDDTDEDNGSSIEVVNDKNTFTLNISTPITLELKPPQVTSFSSFSVSFVSTP